ncbi:MAG: hypothetical protein FHK79_18255 [Pseudomonas sp.]|nr:MAG: hypothetical protein FHK79_18255 [Pseudomonas sp.]
MSEHISVPKHELERIINVLRYGAHPHPSPHADYLATLLKQPAQAPDELEQCDTKRLNFMLQGHRKVIVERLPHDNLAIYVVAGFMGDRRYPAVRYSGDWEQGSAVDLEIKREAIDAALTGEGGAV